MPGFTFASIKFELSVTIAYCTDLGIAYDYLCGKPLHVVCVNNMKDFSKINSGFVKNYYDFNLISS